MSNARNLANLLGTGTTIASAKIADDAITNAKILNDAVTGAKIENNPTIAGNLTIAGEATAQGTTSGFGVNDRVLLNATDGSATDAGDFLVLNSTDGSADDGENIIFETASGDPNFFNVAGGEYAISPGRAFSGVHFNPGGNTGLTGTIIMNTEDFDIGGDYDSSTGIYTVPVTGIYSYSFFGFASASNGTNTTGQKTVSLQTNASGSFADYQGITGKATNNAYLNLSFSGIISATAGEQLKIQTIDSSTHIFASTTSNPQYVPRFSIFLVG